MKFGRLLKTTSDDLPMTKQLFSAYKVLKKQVKRLPYKNQLGQHGTLETLSEEENNFVKALSDTLHQLNEMFLEKEENSVIKVERLEHEFAAATTPEQLNELHKEFVDFHGEVLLLVHWSILAYTATVKILKKHHKRTGLLVKAPQLADLLSQPFCSTELMTSIAHRVEEDIQRLAERMGVSGQRTSEPTQQQQQQAAQGSQAAAAVVAAAGNGLQQLGSSGLDLELLQRLVDSTSFTTPSDTDVTSRDEGAAVYSCRKQHQQGQCSQDADLQDKGTMSEVQSGMKRKRCDAAGELPEPFGEQRQGSSPGHTWAAATQAGVADGQQQPQPVLQLQSDPQQQFQEQQALEPCLTLAPHRCSRTGSGVANYHQQQAGAGCNPNAAALSSPGSPGAASAAVAGGCSNCARQGSILRQTQVALTTWRHLQSTASTPSTVVPGPAALLHASTALTESSAA
eukprot:GHRR01001173.1.p1 GENE.GHRR01001173.1~~GHRR01001173.1.p1  ORF type:complete len:455 (+),score=188.02 GHRR01001173.1:332-1696(+)